MPDAVANSGIDSGVEWLNENKGSEFAGYTFIADGDNLTAVADNLMNHFVMLVGIVFLVPEKRLL